MSLLRHIIKLNIKEDNGIGTAGCGIQTNEVHGVAWYIGWQTGRPTAW